VTATTEFFGFRPVANAFGTSVGMTAILSFSPEPPEPVDPVSAIGSLLVGTPVAIAVYLGERADAVLDALRAWLDLHGQAVVLGTLLVLGVWLVGKGLEGAVEPRGLRLRIVKHTLNYRVADGESR